ncbi:MAG TPA: pyridoxamine 5'-phosphate oxidase family protein [Nocardioidaceae bacterium]
MAAELPELVRQRLQEPTYWHLACIDTDGRPQASPMWVDLRDDRILINTAKSHRKYASLKENLDVGLSNNDATDNPFDHVQIRGRVVSVVEGQEAEDDIDDLARKYIPGAERYDWRAPGEERVTFLIEPTHVRHYRPG